MPVVPLGAPMGYGVPSGATVRERTGLGFVFDHFNIPIPFPRLIAVPKPSEVTFQVPPGGVGYGAPMMPGCVPMGMPMGMGMPISQAGFAAPQVPMGLGAPTFTPQQQALLVQLAAPQQPAGVGAPAVAAPPPVVAAPTVVSDQQCDEIIQKCNVLKRLHQLRQHACDAACCPK